MREWATKKGLPLLKDFSPRVQVSKYHTTCLSSHQTTADTPKKPWTIYLPEKPLKGEPDLRRSVTVWRDDSSRFPLYSTKWDHTPQPAPNLPLDALERVLFPKEFPPRIESPPHFEAQDVSELQHRGHPQGRSTSPWTEVAMHLAEVLEFGHY